MPDTPTCLILGASSDMALAIADAYARRGDRLILAARRPGELERVAADLQLRHGATVELRPFDVLAYESHERFLEELGDLPDRVICCVGVLGDPELYRTNNEHADLVLRSNFNGPALILNTVALRMEERGRGIIVAVSSVAGDRGRASNYVYGSAKAGMTAFLSGLRNRLAKSGVRVITVKPGFVRTRMTAGLRLPPLLTASPQEVARAVVAAESGRRDVLYVRSLWGPLMLLIRAIPEPLFKTLRL